MTGSLDCSPLRIERERKKERWNRFERSLGDGYKEELVDGEDRFLGPFDNYSIGLVKVRGIDKIRETQGIRGWYYMWTVSKYFLFLFYFLSF